VAQWLELLIEAGGRTTPKYDQEIEQARLEALAAALGCTVVALIEWHCRVVAWELDEEAAPLH
jgi:hypothetical protein